ncbi:GAF domain-containing protein [Rhizobium rhizophilum]|uniref:GAF domain-containing protein n=1 Tax=Rhizobium rhizophilum TaxID=1850373 RepID=A0ABY2QUP1_9HYPH|nr:GAF domain-containing protein [Rhizobium rhizophilum]THV12664.1 GAF domain-containing protein [Rhizobium rhizophilum]
MRDLASFYQRATETLATVASEGSKAAGPEEALTIVTAAAHTILGDHLRAAETANLKDGELDQYACGMFFILPGGNKQVLLAPQNYGPEQNHMVIGTDIGHPGWVVANRKPLILKNTDDHVSFVKILKTFRGGSVVYAPIEWNGEFLGQIICAGQARNVMDDPDLEVLVALANLAAALWVAHQGPTKLSSIYETQVP